MRRRLDLAVSLIGRPDVLFLDEPTTGLDPRHRNEVWDHVRGLAADGVTVLLTTQYLEEADQLADDLVGDRPRPRHRGRHPGQPEGELGGQALHVRPLLRADVPRALALLAELGAAPVADATGELVAPALDPVPAAARRDRFAAADIPVAEIGLRLPSLDDVFLALTGHTAEEAA
jgi:oleandomycin transport system ATP-binding protein